MFAFLSDSNNMTGSSVNGDKSSLRAIEVNGHVGEKVNIARINSDNTKRRPAATQDGLGDKMSAKRSKVILPGEMSSEEEGSTGPEDNGGTLGLQKEIADLKSEKAGMEQQLECQQLLIKQLQVQLASLEEKVRAGTASAQLKPRQQLEQRQHQLPSQQQHQQPSQQQHQQPSQQQQHQQPSQQQQQQENEQNQEAIEMDIVGSPASYPEVIIDEGDPFNFVRRRNKTTKNKIQMEQMINQIRLNKQYTNLLYPEYLTSSFLTWLLKKLRTQQYKQQLGLCQIGVTDNTAVAQIIITSK
ncbi:signal transducer and activator of transcription C-like [Hermetia illucens]|uniref:signal transducer and activator of transcription C-like n=1 Tax=Hermetia illucens TaxID=343691 RepID=UPI0018CC19A7|nr:signal transducer and activator of transcription C-like [Hermetia illucens]